MYFFLLQLHVCICMYIFSVDSLKFVIKEFSGQPTPGGGGDKLSLGLGIEIREKFLDREEFGKFSLV